MKSVATAGLTSYDIPDDVTVIGVNAFERITGLESVTIPNSVTSIERETFWGCIGLKSLEIPNSVETIGDNAFQECTSLATILLGNSISSIGSSAFRGCTLLRTHYIYSLNPTPPTLGGDCFKDSYPNLVYLKVPSKSVKEYKAASQWSDFKTIEGLSDKELQALHVGAATASTVAGKLFNLNGVEVGEDFKGIVIQGGKKIVLK